jgi:hypothetical protein
MTDEIVPLDTISSADVHELRAALKGEEHDVGALDRLDDKGVVTRKGDGWSLTTRDNEMLSGIRDELGRDILSTDRFTLVREIMPASNDEGRTRLPTLGMGYRLVKGSADH